MHKRLLTATVLVLMVSAPVIFSQDCTEFSSQTVVFTLAAGAKAAWNQNAAGLKSPRRPEQRNSFSVCCNSAGKIDFKITGFSTAENLQVTLFTLDGKYVATAAMHGRTSGTLNRILSPGIYLARCEAGGTVVQTTRFVAGRQP